MLFSFCLPLHSIPFLLGFLFHFFLCLSLYFVAFSAHVASWHIARLERNIFIILQSGQHLFWVPLRVYKFLFHHDVPSNVKPCNGFEFSHSLSPPAITTSHFLHSSLVYQLYAREVYFRNFATKSSNQSNMHQIFTHMYSTVSLGPS